jgi:hypothetical protein
MFKLGCELNSSVVPIGEPWKEEEDTEPKPVSANTDSTNTEHEEGDEAENLDEKDTASMEDEKINGDYTLMRSALFMYEALVSKEVAQAVAEGDIGRVYEGIKVSHYLSCNSTLLITCSSCCSRLQDLHTTSTPVICWT